MKYLELYQKSITDGLGLISNLSSLPTCPWKDSLNELQKTALEQHYGISRGFKNISEVFAIAPDSSKGMVILAMFGQKWEKLWRDFSLEYDPLHAYVVEESGNREKITDDTHTDTYGRRTQVDGSDIGTVGNEGSESLNGSSGIYGFNSVSAVPSDTQTDVSTTHDTETRNLTNSSSTVNSGSDTRDIDGKENETYSSTKKGNIGYSTPQKLLREDLELWNTPYFRLVFDDIDSFITIQVYDL